MHDDQFRRVRVFQSNLTLYLSNTIIGIVKSVLISIALIFLFYSLSIPIVQAEAGNFIYLDGVINEVRIMQNRNASTQEIADFVNKVVDDRVDALNYKQNKDSDKWDAWIKTDNNSIQHAAVWTWENRVGQCEEHAKLTYYILDQAGVNNLHFLGWEKGGADNHLFVVIGGDNEDYPDFWPDDAIVVDPWQGKTLDTFNALINPWIRNSNLNKIDNYTKIYLGSDAMQIKKNKYLEWDTENKIWQCKKPYIWDYMWGCVKYPCPNQKARFIRYDYRTEVWYCHPPEKYQLDLKSLKCVPIPQIHTPPILQGTVNEIKDAIKDCRLTKPQRGLPSAQTLINQLPTTLKERVKLQKDLDKAIEREMGPRNEDKGTVGVKTLYMEAQDLWKKAKNNYKGDKFEDALKLWRQSLELLKQAREKSLCPQYIEQIEKVIKKLELCEDCKKWIKPCKDWRRYYKEFKEKSDKAKDEGLGVYEVERRMNEYKKFYEVNCCKECFGPIE
jgi:hypothetical protein